MQFVKKSKTLVAALALTAMLSACATPSKDPSAMSSGGGDNTVYKGSVVGKSNKAKTISISVGKGADAKTVMVMFDDSTSGLEFAKKGEAAIINWEQRGEDKFATEIKPKLAKLPEGVTEIKVDEMYALVENGTPMTLVDARPESRYNQGHLPDSISIPVPKLKKMGEKALPKEKDKLLVFYCGGPT